MEQNDFPALVDAAKRGDIGAQEQLVLHYQRRLAGFVFAITGSMESVEDLTQAVFIKVLLGLPKLADPAKFQPWLFRIARNVCLDHLRGEKWRARFTAYRVEHDEVPEPTKAVPLEIEWLRDALLALPIKQRELVTLLQEEDFSYEELAQITNSTLSSVKSRLFRARETLNEWRNREHQRVD